MIWGYEEKELYGLSPYFASTFLLFSSLYFRPNLYFLLFFFLKKNPKKREGSQWTTALQFQSHIYLIKLTYSNEDASIILYNFKIIN